MKLATLKTTAGNKLVGLNLDGRYVDLVAIDGNLPGTLRELLAQPDGLNNAAHALAQGLEQGPFLEGELLAPIPDPGKVICIGLNYADHAAEAGMTPPSEPVVFGKFSSSVCGPLANIVIPTVSEKVDYEAELVLVIGQRGKNIARERAWQHVAGYTCGNDVSARDWQIGRPGSQWLLGKTAETFAPIGPHLVTADEVGDPGNLAVSLTLNGQTMQQSTTAQFLFGVDAIIEHVSKIMTLEPGDLIFTGTPPGVGMGRKPPVWLKPGDEVVVEIESVGRLVNHVVAE